MFHHRYPASTYFLTIHMCYIMSQLLFFLTTSSCSHLLWLFILGLPFATFLVSWFPPLPLSGFTASFCWSTSSSSFLALDTADSGDLCSFISSSRWCPLAGPVLNVAQSGASFSPTVCFPKPCWNVLSAGVFALVSFDFEQFVLLLSF